MKRTKEEVDELIKKAKPYLGRKWNTLGKEYVFLKTGTPISTKEKHHGEKGKQEDNYRVFGTSLKSDDGSTLQKSLEDIIEYFENQDKSEASKGTLRED